MLRLKGRPDADFVPSLLKSLLQGHLFQSLNSKYLAEVPAKWPIISCVASSGVAWSDRVASVHGQVDGSKIYSVVQKVLHVLGPASARSGVPRAKQNENQDAAVSDGKSGYQLQLPSIAWLHHGDNGGSAQATSVQTLPETTMSIEAASLKEAQAAILRKVVTVWRDAGIVQQSYGNLQLAAQPVPVTIPGGGTFPSYIDKDGVQSTSTAAWHGPTYVVSTAAEASDAVYDIMQRCRAATAGGVDDAAPAGQPRSGLSAPEAALVLGFDLEFKAVFEAGAPLSPPALVQVATPGAVYLFHLRSFMAGRMFRESREAVAGALEMLRPLLEADWIYKCGVGVSGDVELLRKFAPGINYQGFMDTELVALSANFKRHSLQALSCLLLGHSIDKRQQCSNWAAAGLAPRQVSYAATDAWVSREISLLLAPLWFPRGGGPLGAHWLAPPRAKKQASPESDAAPASKRRNAEQSAAALPA